MTSRERPVVLLVDDEVRILSALRRSLRREGYEIVTAETIDEALRAIEEYALDVVLSDQKMPGMTGVQLLSEVARRRPDCARMLITGGTEEISPALLERLGVCALVTKPWDDTRLRATLQRALARD